MDSEHSIQLCGPFRINDSLGRTWSISGIRIFDEGYGIIDVYVDFFQSMEDDPLWEDPVVIRQIMARLRILGYAGPDFGPGATGLQDEKLIVLEAPEEFGLFAASKGWKNLAPDYSEKTVSEDSAEQGRLLEDMTQHPDALTAYLDLMRRLGGN